MQESTPTNVTDQSFAAADVKDLLGLSYRQLNDWDKRAGITSQRDSVPEGWRRFSWKQVCALALSKLIRDQILAPLGNIGWFYPKLTEADSALPIRVEFEQCLRNDSREMVLLTDFRNFIQIIRSDELTEKFAKCTRDGELVLVCAVSGHLRQLRHEAELRFNKLALEASQKQFFKKPRGSQKRAMSMALARTNGKGYAAPAQPGDDPRMNVSEKSHVSGVVQNGARIPRRPAANADPETVSKDTRKRCSRI